MYTDSYFKIFTNCLVVKGFNRSLIIDIGRDYFTTIPDSMHEVINHLNKKKSLADVFDMYGEDNREIIDEYLNYLLANDFGIITDYNEFDQFIDMNKTFRSPSSINNCVLEFGKESILYLDRIISDLENLHCSYLQVICYEKIDLSNFILLLQSTNGGNFRSIELVLSYSEELVSFLPTIVTYNTRITSVIIHNAMDKQKSVEENYFPISFIDKEITSFLHCGVIDTKYFEVNRDKVLESLSFNSCLNKKISINKLGEIKNCPAMPTSFGNIKNTTLQEAFDDINFKQHWQISKEKINVCKDCEFRHICTDCRAYVEDPKNIYSKPLKCGYDPYTNEWSDWSTNPLKQKGIEYYELQKMIQTNA
ncbi:grasp-with-spasm system SPASM domain peptide maturase [Flavobacterium sp. LS1R49]|uniref:Grasp-with-spasm system SPASM domain peptide maturase n=1 Tax=Flavobacterium shii TaxID=2987687 RepID=A0A9X2Z8S7_9FLAO|nr:grasp-with-spasm system SPASM domain peptide maturase [Flavobacterium shii]MCV9926266.1 grasp-with-spasm system SPASM domain peptide maturase [Flavobacterium shii]